MLPQVKNEEYRRFYRERRDAGDLLILDNGEYEGKQHVQQFLDAFNFYNPQVAVLPDHLLKPWEDTFNACERFINLFPDTFSAAEWMYVPQAEKGDLIGFIEGMMKFDDLPEKVKWIGLPRVLATDICPDVPFIRSKCARWLRNHFGQFHIHALGMVRGDVEELHSMSDLVDSCDSSAPVWRGWNSYQIDSWVHQEVWEAVGSDVNWDEEKMPDEVADQCIKYNLNLCGVLWRPNATANQAG